MSPTLGHLASYFEAPAGGSRINKGSRGVRMNRLSHQDEDYFNFVQILRELIDIRTTLEVFIWTPRPPYMANYRKYEIAFCIDEREDITGTYRDIPYLGMGPYPNVDMCFKVL